MKMMKKLLILTAILTLVFTACEQPTNEDNTSKLPNLTIRNESSFVLTTVTFSGIPFAASGNDMPVSSQVTKQLTNKDTNIALPVTFVVNAKGGIALRTQVPITVTTDVTFVINDNTFVEEVGNPTNSKSLLQIEYVSNLAVKMGVTTVVKNENVTLGEGIIDRTVPHEFTLNNTGSGKFILRGTTPIQITGTGAEAFSIAQLTGTEAAPNGGSLPFTINFTPKAEQIYTAAVTVNYNNQDPFTFTITAAGVPPKPIAKVFLGNAEIPQNGTIDAGEVLITQSTNITVVISNTGSAVLTLDTANITITGADAEAFSKTTNPGGSISAGEQSSFIIECKPVKEGENTAVLTIPTNDNSRNPIIIFLKVTGNRGSAILELTQTSAGTVIENNSLDAVEFGHVEVSSYQTLSFTIKNTGNITLNLPETSPVTSTNAAFAIQAQPVTKTLGPGASTTFTIRFTPNAEGNAAASIDIPNDGDEGTFTFAVAGTGYVKRPQIIISYDNTTIAQNGTIDAGEVFLTLSKNITVVIKNTGEEVLTVDTANITITGNNAAAFTKSTNPGGSISVGGESSFIIKCEPVVQGENTAALTIPSNDINRNPAVIYLKTTGVKGSAVLELSRGNTIIENNSSTPAPFGQAVVGGTPMTVEFNITNKGNIAFNLTGTPAIESSNPVFSVNVQPAITTLNPEASTTFRVRYTPTAEGEATGTITIANNSDAGTFTFTVAGNGYENKPQITISQETSMIQPGGEYDFGTILTGKTSEITFTIGNSGDANLSFITINNNRINLADNDSGFFVITQQPSAATVVTPENTTTFTVRFSPTTIGSNFSATVQINTNSRDNNEFSFRVKGTGRGYIIGEIGPGGGLVFYAEGNQFKECSDVLGVGTWSSAVYFAANYRGGGYTDWYLPEIWEVKFIYQNLYLNDLGDFYDDDELWSSTEVQATGAMILDFWDGVEYPDFKTKSGIGIIPIRSFSL